MVTAKKVFWTEAAKNNLFKVYNRLASKSKNRADEVVNAILLTTEKLNTEYPKGNVEPLLKNETDPYKNIIVGFYKVIYSIVEDTVVVEAVYHQRQDPLQKS